MTLCGALVLAGCTPSIGDKCALSTDCSSRGDRLCDVSQPDGYCTAFNCTGDDCPTEAVCVLFPGAVAGCGLDDRRDPGRTGRSMCLLACASGADCRAGYVCADPTTQPYGARFLADTRSTVCLVAASGLALAVTDSGSSPVCSPNGSNADAAIVVDAALPDASAPPDASDASEPAADAAAD